MGVCRRSLKLEFSLGINGEDYTFDSVEAIIREDVAKHVVGAPSNSGFSCKINLDKIGSTVQLADPVLRVHAKGHMRAVSIDKLSSIDR